MPATPVAVLAEHRVDDRDDVGEALARAGAGRQDVVRARPGDLDRLALVPVQHDRVAAGVLWVGLAAEDPLRLRVQQAVSNQLRYRPARREGRVQPHPRVGPLHALVELLVDERLDALVADLHEART